MSEADEPKKQIKPPNRAVSLFFLLQILLSLLLLGVVIWKLGPLSQLLTHKELSKQSRFVPPKEGTWRFVVSGDSRNSGDVVMPAIAARGIEKYQPTFYWHLGNLRATYKINE